MKIQLHRPLGHVPVAGEAMHDTTHFAGTFRFQYFQRVFPGIA